MNAKGQPYTTLEFGVFKSFEKIQSGTRVYINNKISHYQETEGDSVHHRLARVIEHSKNGRVHCVTGSGHMLWRKKKNLNSVLAE